MAGNPRFLELLDRIKSIHEKKSADYAAVGSPYENFERAAVIVSWFKDPVDQVFATLIGVKLARIANLSSKEGPSNNESIDDSFLDHATYSNIWASYRMRNLDRVTNLPPYLCAYCGVRFSHSPFGVDDSIYCSEQCVRQSMNVRSLNSIGGTPI